MCLESRFLLTETSESSKTEWRKQNLLSFLGCFWKCLAVFEEMTEFSKWKCRGSAHCPYYREYNLETDAKPEPMPEPKKKRT